MTRNRAVLGLGIMFAMAVLGLSSASAETCCSGLLGDANNDGHDEPSISDISVIIDVLFIRSDWSKIPCIAEADFNGSGGNCPTESDITIGDIARMIDYLFISFPCNYHPSCARYACLVCPDSL